MTGKSAHEQAAKIRATTARTAAGPVFIAAVEQFEPAARRILDEPYAARMLPRPLRYPLPVLRSATMRRLSRQATERQAPGLWGEMLCRKRYARDQVAAAKAAGARQLVVLGAGVDPLSLSAGLPAFETDMPENIAVKRARLDGIDRDVRLVPVRFETDDLGEALRRNGFDIALPTVFVWEGVTQYLTEADVRRTFGFLSTAAPGSRLAFTYVHNDFLTGANHYGAETLVRSMVRTGVWKFALAPSEVDGMLREYGWREREQAGTAEYRARYVEPTGRDLPVSGIERFVLAEKAHSS